MAGIIPAVIGDADFYKETPTAIAATPAKLSKLL
jgi:hypothetical protein